MKLYHTSNIEIQNPDIIHSREHLDFGRGFYLTSLRDQAEKYAQRFLRKGEDAFLNIYELDDELQGFTNVVFEAYDNKWLDFVTACRKGQKHELYDIIEGGIADDKMPDLMYFAENADTAESEGVREYGKILETGGVSEDEI